MREDERIKTRTYRKKGRKMEREEERTKEISRRKEGRMDGLEVSVRVDIKAA